MKMRVLSTLAASAALMTVLGLAAAPAQATVIFVGPGATSTPFGHNVGAGASFTNTFTFNLAKAGTLSGTISSPFNTISLGSKTRTQNIVFTLGSVKLDGNPFLFSSDGVGISAQGSLAVEPIAPGLHVLTVTGKNFGNTLSSYAGTLNFLPSVPEPATWAMMIMGFGMLGLAGRRRRVLAAI
jgi:hypothetical protein